MDLIQGSNEYRFKRKKKRVPVKPKKQPILKQVLDDQRALRKTNNE